jgi:hypothetical protein
MIPAHTYEEVLDQISKSFIQNEQKAGSSASEPLRLIGLLFARPESDFSKTHIVPNLNYFNERSGASVDFFLIGYGAYWTGAFTDTYKEVVDLGSSTMFSNGAFVDFTKQIEEKTKWKYSGSADLILLNSRYDTATQRGRLIFTNALAFDLEKAVVKLQVIDSVQGFFEAIFRYAEEQKDDNLLHGLKTQQFKQAGVSLLLAAAESLPVVGKWSSKEQLQRAFYLLTREVGKKPK